MVSKAFLDLVKARNSKRNGDLKKLKRPPKWLLPLSIERQYISRIWLYTLEIRKEITEQVMPKIPFWLTGGTITYPDPTLPEKIDSLIDDIISNINFVMGQIRIALQPSQQSLINSVLGIGLEIAAFNQVQYSKTMNSVLGVDVFLEEPWLEPQLELFANQNSQLIENMTQNEIERVSGIIQRAIQEGANYESTVINIEKSFGITRRHARLIARDQTTKLNASLTKLRQQEAGVDEYIWQTAGDERVRADHRALDGKTCRWDDPTVYLDKKSGKWLKRSSIGGTLVHVGTDVNCRCIAIPVIEGMFD